MQKSMEIEVVGRHALLFDDDAMAAFVNSDDALVDWNSIPIDRYDVRHLLSSPPPPRRRRITQQLPDSIETELDQERYLDLSYEKQETDDGWKPVDAGGYNAVAFSYGNGEDSADQKNSDSGLGLSAFSPTFSVPENLVIPPTEKLHHIIARTAIFVSKHGGQSEIVLRVKQGDNPTFGFLMPDHHLHSYFRFLVDHSEVLQSHIEEKAQNDKMSGSESGGGALSLLGSLYGSGEDEDGAAEYVLTSKENDSSGAINATSAVSHMSEKTVSPKTTSMKDDLVSDHLINSKDKVPVKPKEKLLVPKRNSFSTGLKAGSSSGTRKELESIGSYSAADKLQSSSMAPSSMIEPLVVEPPSEMKKLIAKIVEFIIKNGKQFEAVLVEQDSEHGRFPFLSPSNRYNQYYLKVLHEALKSKVPGRRSVTEKNDGLGFHGSDKKSLVSKGGSFSLDSVGCDIPFDSDRKEKFKMVIGKSKNDGQDPSSKSTQQQTEIGVDATAAAAILQAATRGIGKPNLEFFSRFSLNGNNQDHSNGGGQDSSLSSLPSSQPQSAMNKSGCNGLGSSASVVKDNAKTAALEAASEADSHETHLTREQKLKAERLRRAKMFVAMMRSGSVPQMKPGSSRGTSVEPQGPDVGAEDNRAAQEGISGPEIDTAENIVSSAKKCSTDEYNERKARRKYRSNCSNHEAAKEDNMADDEDEVVHKHSRKKRQSHRFLAEDDDNEEQDEEDKEIKHPRKKQQYRAADYSDEEDDDKYSRKHRRSRHDKDEEDDDKCSRKHRRSRHDSDENDDDKYSRKHRRSRHDEDEEDEGEHDKRHSRKKHRSRRSSHHSRHHSGDSRKHRKTHSSSKDKGSRHQSKPDLSSEEEHLHHIGSDKRYGKVSQSEREELEEGEISAKVSDQSRGSVGGGAREPSVDVSSSFQDRNSSQPTEVSDDLRAKIRAMLLGAL